MLGFNNSNTTDKKLNRKQHGLIKSFCFHHLVTILVFKLFIFTVVKSSSAIAERPRCRVH